MMAKGHADIINSRYTMDIVRSHLRCVMNRLLSTVSISASQQKEKGISVNKRLFYIPLS